MERCRQSFTIYVAAPPRQQEYCPPPQLYHQVQPTDAYPMQQQFPPPPQAQAQPPPHFQAAYHQPIQGFPAVAPGHLYPPQQDGFRDALGLQHDVYVELELNNLMARGNNVGSGGDQSVPSPHDLCETQYRKAQGISVRHDKPHPPTLSMALAPDTGVPFLFAKFDLKDGYWRMVVNESDAWNFAYVLLPANEGDKIELVIHDSLQTGWGNPPIRLRGAPKP